MGTIRFTPKVFVEKHNEFYGSDSESDSESGSESSGSESNIVAIQSLLAQLKAIDVTRIKVQNYILSLNVKIKQQVDEIERINVAPKIVEVFVDKIVTVPVVQERLVDRVVEVEKIVRVVEEHVVEVPTEIVQFLDKAYVPRWIYLLPIIQVIVNLYIYLNLGA